MPYAPVSDAEIYARSLLSRCHGYPLWVPEPYGVIAEHQSVGVRVGDVGYVTEDGAFETLFNVRAEANDPINRRGVPNGFQSIDIDDEDITDVIDFHQPGAIPCRSGTQGGLSLGVSTADNPLLPATAGVGLEVTWNSTEGAVVHLPSGAARVRIPPEQFREYIFENAKSWYDFVNGKLRRGVPPGSLYLVTACDKAYSWMVGAFSEASSGRSVSLKVGALGVGQVQGAFSYAWENIRAPTYRSGPRVPRMPVLSSDRLLHGNEEQSNGPPPVDRSAPGGRNQCIFIRGFSIALKKSFFKQREETKVSLIEEFKPSDILRLSKQYSSSQFSSRKQPGGGGSTRSRHTQQTSPRGVDELDFSSLSLSDSDEEVEVEFVPSTLPPFHPSVLLNQCLFEAIPEAEIAITHDDDWCILADDNANIPGTLDLRTYIISTSGGAYFAGLETLVEDPPTPLGSVDNEAPHQRPARLADPSVDENNNGRTRELRPDTPTGVLRPPLVANVRSTRISTQPSDTSAISSEMLSPLQGLASTEGQDSTSVNATMESRVSLRPPLSSSASRPQAMDQIIIPLEAFYGTTASTAAPKERVGTSSMEEIDDRRPSSADDDLSIMTLIAEKFATPNERDEHGRTALSYLCEEGLYAQAVHFVQELGADPNIANIMGRTPISYAADFGSYGLVPFLLSSGAEADKADDTGRTPLSYAAENGHEEYVSILLGAGANPNSVDSEHVSPLMYAAVNGHATSAAFLTQAGADVNAVDSSGRTALSHACEQAQVLVIKYLMRQDGNPSITDNQGRTPEWYAEHIDVWNLRAQCLPGSPRYAQLNNPALVDDIKGALEGAIYGPSSSRAGPSSMMRPTGSEATTSVPRKPFGNISSSFGEASRLASVANTISRIQPSVPNYTEGESSGSQSTDALPEKAKGPVREQIHLVTNSPASSAKASLESSTKDWKGILSPDYRPPHQQYIDQKTAVPYRFGDQPDPGKLPVKGDEGGTESDADKKRVEPQIGRDADAAASALAERSGDHMTY